MNYLPIGHQFSGYVLGMNQFNGGGTRKQDFPWRQPRQVPVDRLGYFQKGDLVITIKRPDYIADFLKKVCILLGRAANRAHTP